VSKKKFINMDDPADKARVILNRLRALAQEQGEKRNTAMQYVLDDLHSKLDEFVSEVAKELSRHGTGEQK